MIIVNENEVWITNGESYKLRDYIIRNKSKCDSDHSHVIAAAHYTVWLEGGSMICEINHSGKKFAYDKKEAVRLSKQFFDNPAGCNMTLRHGQDIISIIWES